LALKTACEWTKLLDEHVTLEADAA
jgi:hypothetical protein